LARYKVQSDKEGGILYYYESIWKSWIEWCRPSLAGVYNLDEDSVAGFISSLWAKGAAAARVKSTLSVLETTKKVLYPQRTPFLNNGLIRSLIDAAVVNRPVKRRGPQDGALPFYDVARIFDYWSRSDDNSTLPMTTLRAKTASLLTIDTHNSELRDSNALTCAP
jgi:hypothetical protein